MPRKTGIYPLPAPILGLNTRDQFVEMDLRYAIQLRNWFPGESGLTLRPGSTLHATVTHANAILRSFIPYQAPNTANSKLFVVSDNGIYDVTSGGTVAATVSTGITNGFGRAINFTNSVGSIFAQFWNGVDAPRMWDGATWSSPTITGVTSSTCMMPWVGHHRIWVIQKNTTDVWYLPLDSIQGAATKYPLGALLTRGGYLVDGITWTLDGGDGMDALTAIVSSEGELIVFQGYDPSSADTWRLKGVYQLGRPASKEPFVRIGADVGYLQSNGVFLLSKALISAAVNNSASISNAIEPTFLTLDTNTYEGTHCLVYPKRNALLVNHCTFNGNTGLGDTAISTQYVMNTLTGAWTTFSNWSSARMCLFNGELYGCTAIEGGYGVVRKYWDLTTRYYDWDLTTQTTPYDITGYLQTPFTDCGRPAMLKQLELFRALITHSAVLGTNTYDLKWNGAIDYAVMGTTTTNADLRAAETSSLTWVRRTKWNGMALFPGQAISLFLRTDTKTCALRYNGMQMQYRLGGLW